MNHSKPTQEYPLSLGQERLWFEDQFDPGTSTYNVSYCFRMRGKLDARAFERSIRFLVERHEVLRSIFRTSGGATVQVVGPFDPASLTVDDYRSFPVAEREERALRLVREDARLPFDLRRGPLLRVRVVRLGPADQLLMVAYHHTIADGVSIPIFFRDLAEFYDACLHDRAAVLPPLPFQYGEYAVRQRAYVKSDALARQIAFWKEQLGGELPPLDLPTDLPRPAVRSSAGAEWAFNLPLPLTQRLKGLAAQQRTTLFMLLLSAFKTFLFRYTGREDLLVGTPIAGRTSLDTENLIGFFVNTLVLRTSLGGDPTFLELLHRTRDVCLAAFENQEAPLEKIVEEVRPVRDVSRTPLFQVLFTHNTTDLQISWPGFILEGVSLPTATAKFDLMLMVSDVKDGLRCLFEYSSGLFEPGTIKRWAESFHVLLDAIAAEPNRHLSEFPVMGEAEVQRIIHDLSGVQTVYPRHTSIPRLFQEIVERDPGAPALVSEQESLTYGELNARANRLAHHLQKRGVSPGARVGLCLERSVDAVVSMVAILKAGGAYVPLDPSYPIERQRFIVNDAQISFVVTDSKFSPISEEDRILIDTNAATIRGESSDTPLLDVRSDEPAYVMYTSGSTGEPKGVIIPHRGVVRLVKATTYAEFSPEQRFLQLAPLSFDASTFEIWGSLLNGAQLVVPPPSMLTLRELGDLIRGADVTTLWLTAGLFNQMVDENLECFAGVRQLLTGGDVVSPAHARKFKERYPSCRLVNGYGPTENTTFTCCHEITNDFGDAVPIGRPIPNTQVYLLDRKLRPVPIGCEGELCIAGDGLALGYLGRPELNRETFIAHPFAPTPGARLYRSGDMARFCANGSILFLGRRDSQVKIRGFRVELGEIEAALSGHPSVREVAVVARKDTHNDKMLVAYCVLNAGQHVSSTDLRSWLKGKLPEFMIPSGVVFIDQLPLTPQGKIDRNALPKPDLNPTAGTVGYAPPRDIVEEQLTRIWEKLLGKAPIGTNDNFFELGGHSLLAFRLFAELERLTGYHLPLVTLFQAATIGQLANVIRQKGWQPQWSCLVPMKPGGSRLPMYFIHGVGGNVLSFRDLAQHLPADQPVYGLQSLGLDGKQAPLVQVEDMASRYISEIRLLQPTGPYCLGGLSFGGVVAYEMARQLTASGETVGLMALLDTYAYPYTITRAEMIREYFIMLGRRSKWHLQHLSRLSTRGRIEYIRTSIRNFRGRIRNRYWQLTFDHEHHDESTLTDALQNVKEGNYVAARRFRARPYAGCVTLFRAEYRGLGSLSDPVEQWKSLATGGVRVITVPGDHVTMLNEPHVRVLARRLDECLAEVNARSQVASGHN